MAEPLKHFFDRARVAGLARDLVAAGLDPTGFEEAAVCGLDPLELLDRGRHVARALRAVLPVDGREALVALVRTFGPELVASDGNGMAPFRYLPHGFLIGELGVAHPEEGHEACHAVTRRFTAEWCVRPILEAHPERTFAALHTWVTDPNEPVRRLVSEGTRPRLPWAPRVAWLVADPGPGLALLERLVDDPSEYVGRSVANHLSDVAKEHPVLAVETAHRWWVGASTHPGALAVQGFGGAAVRIGRVPLQVLTTRTPYPGEHTVEVQVNGARFPGGRFDVEA